jgi:hypothetical protein
VIPPFARKDRPAPHDIHRWSIIFDVEDPVPWPFKPRRRLLDHPDVLAAVREHAADLRGQGEFQQACELDRDILDRRRRTLGEDHPDTLDSANDLAVDLSELGELEQACELDRDTLDRRRRTLGHDHPHTLKPPATWPPEPP